MLEPRFTVNDLVVYQFEHETVTRTGIIVDGPYREGIWWEYTMRDGSMVRDAEVSHLLHRVSNAEILFDSGV